MLESGHSRRYSRAMTDSSTANPLLAPNHALPDFGAIRAEHVERRLRHYSYLNAGLKLIFNGKEFVSRHGLMDLVMEDLQTDNAEPIYPPLHYTSKTLEFCFTHTNSRYGESFYSFVNGQYTSDGGTSLRMFSSRLRSVRRLSCSCA
mgnify:CR=1 FL=1